MEKNNIENKKLKELLQDSKCKASENLQYRIMQQIETESIIAKKAQKKTRSIRPLMSVIYTVCGVMYGLILLLGIVAYRDGDIYQIFSSTYLIPIVFISVICSAFILISLLDEKRYLSKKD